MRYAWNIGNCSEITDSSYTMVLSSSDMFKEVGRLSAGDMELIWISHLGAVQVCLVPSEMAGQIPAHREYLDGDSPAFKGWRLGHDFENATVAVPVDSCLQVAIAGDTGFNGSAVPGECQFNSQTVLDTHLVELTQGDGWAELRFVNEAHSMTAVQRYEYRAGARWVSVTTSVTNEGASPLVLTMAGQFSLGMVSPFQAGLGKDRCELLEWHSAWAGEGRLEKRSLESMGLEPSWGGWNSRSYRIGATSSWPVQNAFPQLGLHDKEAGVVWGMSVAAVGPWMMYARKAGDFASIGGGLPDREYNGWFKELAPGETMVGLENAVTVCRVPEGVSAEDAVCNRLVGYSETLPENMPEGDKDAPAMFNDWCYTWGVPTREKLRPILERLAGTGVAYLTMDFGWFYSGEFGRANLAVEGKGDLGDWNPREDNYPDGLDQWLDEIRSKGLRPGVWFELENAVKRSIVYKEHPEWLLTLDGKILTRESRAFLDFRKKEVVDYLSEKVIRFVKEHNIGFIKSDYNAPIGSYCDGPCASKSENARQAIEAQAAFYKKLRREVPNLTLEICASGGRRLTPFWMQLGTLASSSDAHEGVEIPLLAADTCRLIAMRSNEIWATLHPWDDDDRLMYSLYGGCMGRLCLSGDLDKLSDGQMAFVRKALAYYDAIRPILKAGDTYVYRQLKSLSYIEPEGAQLFTRVAKDGGAMMAIVHTFKKCDTHSTWTVPGQWELSRCDALDGVTVKTAIAGNSTRIECAGMREFSACALIFKAK